MMNEYLRMKNASSMVDFKNADPAVIKQLKPQILTGQNFTAIESYINFILNMLTIIGYMYTRELRICVNLRVSARACIYIFYKIGNKDP